MAKVFAAKEATHAKVKRLEKKRLQALLNVSDGGKLSESEVQVVVLNLKDEAANSLMKCQQALESQRTERSRAEGLMVDLRSLRGDYARLSDTLLHLQV